MIPEAERHRDTQLLDNIPEELRTRPQWVVWKMEPRNGKDTKVPYSARQDAHGAARGAGKASSTDSMTWATFEGALDALNTGRYRGVGFVFTSGDPYAGVDLDNCRDPKTGELETWATEIVDSLDGYTEVSQSGTGVHIIVRGKAPNKRRGDVEAYSSERYFTMTGRGDPVEILEREEPLADLTHRFLTAPEPQREDRPAASTRTPDLSDEEVLTLCRRARNAPKFEALYDAGDTAAHDGDDSAADLALLGVLRFYTQDPEQLERLFDGSALGQRPKWRTRRDYRQRTIQKALAGLSEAYEASRAPITKEDHPLSTQDDEVTREFNQIIRSSGERPAAMPFNTTDIGNAERLVARHGEQLRYVHPWGKWLEYDGTRYRVDSVGAIFGRAKETTRHIYEEARKQEYRELREKLAIHAVRSETRSRIEAMVALARSEEGIPVRPEDLDADPWLLNVQNGTLDLKTGELRKHQREDLITKLCPTRYDADASAPEWEAFLERVLPSKGLRTFVQRAVGYSLTGDTRERILLILHGMGRNGKSTFLEAIREALGAEDGYAMKTPAETLMAKPAGGIPNDIARLKGARFVAASETERGRRLAEALVKEITGNDTISARFMRAEWFDFRPTHKVWLATNHKPEVQGTDPAIWDRIRLVPFAVRITDEEIDSKLPEKLRAELPGILAWAVRGCLDWQREGLGQPDEVRHATEEYRSEMDTLAAFIEDRCVVHPNAETNSGALYEAYTSWCEENGERAEKQRSFGTRLTERGFERGRGTRNTHVRRGLGLRSDREPDPPRGSDPTSDPTTEKGHSEKSPQTRTILSGASDRSDRSDPQIGMNEQNDSHGEPNPELGSLRSLGSLDAGEVLDRSDMAPALASYLAAPPKDLLRQAEKCAREGGTDSRLFNPLVSSVAYEVYKTCAGGRRDEVRPAVEAWVHELQERARDA